MHKTLERQLRRLFGAVDNVPSECQKLLEVVSRTYTDFQNEYELIERSLEISSTELTELNQQLRKEVQVENQLTERLKKEAEIIEEQVQIRTKELSIERSKLALIAQNMVTGAVLLNNAGEVLFINNQACKFIHFFDSDYTKLLDSLYSTFSNCPIEEYIHRSLRGESLQIDDIRLGSLIFNISFQVLTDNSMSSGVMIWISDVTEEKLLERAKSELVAVASHQLRSPLTVTKGNTEILLDESYGKLTDEQKDIIKQTHESNENMILLVNQMLDITKIEQGDFSQKFTDVNVKDVLENAIKNLTPHAKANNIVIDYQPTSQEIPLIKGDGTRLYQVFQNLIDNSIKYIRHDIANPKVNISTETVNGCIIIKIEDQGIGIPLREQTEIFGRFYRASNAENSFVNGTGLGLFIVKTIIESMGGTISFVSEENKGTIFTIKFLCKNNC